MSLSEIPCLSVAIAPLTRVEAGHYAVWVLQAPYPGGYVHHDCSWTTHLGQAWQEWQSLFSLRNLPDVPRIPPTFTIEPVQDLPPDDELLPPGQTTSYTSRLMQELGVSLWKWLFDGSIQASLSQSQGIAMGQGKPLRFRLEVRDPDLIAIPWEIMQPQPGKQAISLSQMLLFSRTTSDVDPLPPLRTEQMLKVLLVLGHNPEAELSQGETSAAGVPLDHLQLEQEAQILAELLTRSVKGDNSRGFAAPVPCRVETLLQPSPSELNAHLESGNYNVFFYSGHGMSAPDGGLLFLSANETMNGTELAQVLTRCRVKLAVFNACWGAQPDQDMNHHSIPRSSLAEVLIHHGVPAVLGMRDSISDREALSFIQVFAQTLAERLPIDQAVAIARQHLLTLYKFNQPAWTLPVLYMHPEFDGELIKPVNEGVTEIPDATSSPWFIHPTPTAHLRSLNKPSRSWPIQGGLMRVGSLEGNDLVLREPGVSRKHAEIFYRDGADNGGDQPTYFLKDFSRFGTLIQTPEGWQKVHHREIPLPPHTRLKFGSSRSQTLEFVIDA
jgi:hypothetical protein